MTTDRTSGPVAVVTGGSTVIGFRIALHLITDGFHVALLDRDGAQENAEALGAGVLGVRVDVGDERDMGTALARVVDRFGRLDHLVNHAGAAAVKGFWGRTNRVKTLSAGLRGVNVGMQVALPYLRTSGRSGVVNIAPVAPVRGVIGGKPYCAEHMSVIGMTLKAAREHEGEGVRVNAIVPIQDHPQLGVLGAPHELAAAVSFLCSERATSVTGEIVPVDTGYMTV